MELPGFGNRNSAHSANVLISNLVLDAWDIAVNKAGGDPGLPHMPLAITWVVTKNVTVCPEVT